MVRGASVPSGPMRSGAPGKKPAHSKPRLRRPTIPRSLAGGFGSDTRGAMALYQGGGTGSVTTKSELGLQVVDFFDYQSASTTGVPQFVHNYYWNIDQNLFNNGNPPGGEDLTYCRPRKLHVWVLPQARGIDATASDFQVNSNADAMYTVNCQVPGIPTTVDTLAPIGEPKAFALNTQVTNVLPQYDSKWKKVLTCDYQRTFKSGMVRPVFAGLGINPSSTYNQLLFQMSIVDPTTGQPLQNGSADDPSPGIKVKVQIEIDQPIQLINQAQLAVFRNEEFGLPFTGQNEPDFPGTQSSYVQMNLLRAQDLRR